MNRAAAFGTMVSPHQIPDLRLTTVEMAMGILGKWWFRRPARVLSPLARRFRAELEVLEDRVTPSQSPTAFTLQIIGPKPSARG